MTIGHPFASPAQLESLAAQLAGSGAESSRPFQLRLTTTKSFAYRHTELSGSIDLSCGLSCFGDAGLQKATGSPVGVNPAPLEKQAGEQPAQVLRFTLSAALPGTVVSTDASGRSGSVVTWTPVVGQKLTLDVVTRTTNAGHRLLVDILVGAGVLFVVILLVLGRRRPAPSPASTPKVGPRFRRRTARPQQAAFCRCSGRSVVAARRMARLLVVHHTPSPATHAMLLAVLDGARDRSIAGVEVSVRAALHATASDVLDADGYVLGSPVNLGYLSGALKHFFDQIYYPCLEDTRGRPFGVFLHGNADATGAVRAVQTITTGLGWRAAAPILEVAGEPAARDLDACRELGAAMAATISLSA